MNSKNIALILIAILVAFLVFLGPTIFIWSLNTLFNLGIDYNFNTWAASFFLIALFAANSNSKGNK